MSNDSWLMGALAADDAYRGDDPQWPPAPQPGTVFNSPWERGVAIASDYAGRDTPPASATEEPPEMGSLLGMGRAGETAKRAGQGFVKAVDYYAGMPKRVYEGVQPETPGQWSEGDEARKQQLLGAQYEWAPSTAFGMTFDPFGVKRSVGGVTLGAGAGGGSKIIQPTEGIRAYHSSPHDFEKFDLSKIGTGEGAQSYGHGIYAAENPAVSGQGGQYWSSFADRFQGPEGLATDFLHANNFDRKEAAAMLRRAMDNGPVYRPGASPASSDEARSALALLRGGKPVGPRTYEVDINAKPEQFLDWDKPLREQPRAVQQLYENSVSYPRPTDKGEEIYRGLSRTGGSIGSAYSDILGSKTLHEAGIPGIRYLDQGSRVIEPQYNLSDPGQLAAFARKIAPDNPAAAIDIVHGKAGDEARRMLAARAELPQLVDTAKRTSNYVVFDPAKIAILRKYGLAGAVPTMGALASQDRYAE